MPNRRRLGAYSHPKRNQCENSRMVSVCQPLGNHFMYSEISSAIEERLADRMDTSHAAVGIDESSLNVSDCKPSKNSATDCLKKRADRTGGVPGVSVPVISKAHRLPRTRKHFGKRMSRCRDADFRNSKFGGDILRELCTTSEVPHISFSLENYREQLRDILGHLDRNDLLPLLEHSQPLVEDLVERHYMIQSGKVVESSPPVLRSSACPSPALRRSPRLNKKTDKPVTCEVKMRVRIQYKSHKHLLAEVESIKNTETLRQLDKFDQASTIMRGRDTGCVVCNISFSDITYLGAFWRDYINGALQDALRGVFLTEMLLQTAGDEELDLLVSVDEKDFVNGQKLLVKNLQLGHSENVQETGTSLGRGMGVPATARVER